MNFVANAQPNKNTNQFTFDCAQGLNDLFLIHCFLHALHAVRHFTPCTNATANSTRIFRHASQYFSFGDFPTFHNFLVQPCQAMPLVDFQVMPCQI